MFHTQGVIAKRLGGGLQNRSDRFDSDSRLHFFAFFPNNCFLQLSFAGGETDHFLQSLG